MANGRFLHWLVLAPVNTLLLRHSWSERKTLSDILVSLLTVPNKPKTYESVDELVRQDDIQWIVEAGSSFVQMGENAKEGETLR